MTAIVYGPPGCGKTRNAIHLAHHFKVKRIVDDWDPERHDLTIGALHLTNVTTEYVLKRGHKYDALNFEAVVHSDARFVAPRFKPNRYTSGGRP